jgi:hypothetical protein
VLCGPSLLVMEDRRPVHGQRLATKVGDASWSAGNRRGAEMGQFGTWPLIHIHELVHRLAKKSGVKMGRNWRKSISADLPFVSPP